MKRKLPVVAIDGPAGSGKSTLAKLLAKRLHFVHVDTGAIYRGVAWLALHEGVDLLSEQAVVDASRHAHFEFRSVSVGGEDEANHLFLNGEDVAGKIRTSEVSAMASKVSAYPGIRSMLLGLQRMMGREGGAVLEGRDIGTVVFPDAEAKIFLTATVEERARRRLADLKTRGMEDTLENVKDEITKRDHQDSTRAIAPMKQADDAVLVDTTSMTIEMVLDRLEELVKQKC